VTNKKLMTVARKAEARAAKAAAKATARAAKTAEVVAEARAKAKAEAAGAIAEARAKATKAAAKAAEAVAEAEAKAFQKAAKKAERAAAKENLRTLAAAERAAKKAAEAEEALRDATESPRKLSKNGGYFPKEENGWVAEEYKKQVEEFEKEGGWRFDGKYWSKVHPDGTRDLQGTVNWLLKKVEETKEYNKKLKETATDKRKSY
jgi:hypothetical protein